MHALRLEPRAIGQGTTRNTPRDRPAGQYQFDALICRANEMPGVHEARQVLPLGSRRQRHDVSPWQSQSQHRPLAHRPLDRAKLRPNPSGNNCDSLRCNAEQAHDLIAGVLRDSCEVDSTQRQRTMKRPVPDTKSARMIVGKAVRKQIVQRHQLPRHTDRSGVAWRPKWSAMHAGERRQVALLPRMTPGSAESDA